MTDSEIIKALEIHINEFDKTGISVDNNRLDKLTLDLINRQRAEIEKLKIENRILSQKRANIFEILTAFERGEEKGRLDAVKEFVERLCKDRVSNDPVVIEPRTELKEWLGDKNDT